MNQQIKEPAQKLLKPLVPQKKALLEDIRKAAEIVSVILLELKDLTKPGVALDMLDEYAAKRIKELGGEPAFLGYQPSWSKTPFLNTLCTSIDFEIAHGIPTKRELKEGQIIKYDLGVKYKSAFGDAAITVAVGEIDSFKQRLMRLGKEATQVGIAAVKAGAPLSSIGRAIENYCLSKNLEIIKDFGGHHIGSSIHEEPLIYHFHRKKDDELLLEEGRVICIEPMVTRAGYSKIGIADDGWTAFQVKGQPVVQWEAMVLIKKDGYEVLTTWDK